MHQPWFRFVVGRHPRRTLARALGLAVLAYTLFGHSLLPVRVTGDSMAPTYRSGRLNLVNVWAYAGRRVPQQGDVVAVRLAGRRVLFLKRVVALPGDQVAFEDGVLFRNGQPEPEPYVRTARRAWQHDPVTLAPDQYYLVGDNRDTSQRGHVMGRVRRERIVGRIVF